MRLPYAFLAAATAACGPLLLARAFARRGQRKGGEADLQTGAYSNLTLVWVLWWDTRWDTRWDTGWGQVRCFPLIRNRTVRDKTLNCFLF